MKVRIMREAKGSATIEMACIMPLFLSLFLLIITGTFYFHDKCVLYATAYETAVVGAQKKRQENTFSESVLQEYFEDRIEGKLIFFPDAAVSLQETIGVITVQAEAVRGRWKIHAEEKAMLMRTEELIYISGQIGEGDENE